MNRSYVVIAGLVGTVCCARRAGAQTITDSHYAIDLSRGVVLGPGRAIGLAGAYTALVDGVDGVLWNPAAFGTRSRNSASFVRIDPTISYSRIAGGPMGDFYNTGSTTQAYNDFNVGLPGLAIQIGPAGIGDMLEYSAYRVGPTNGEQANVTVMQNHLGTGWAFLDSQLVIGAAWRYTHFTIQPANGGVVPLFAGPQYLTYSGHSFEVGAVWRPAGLPFRAGAAFRSEADAGHAPLPATAGVMHVGACAAGRSCYVVPDSVVAPWEVNVGFAVQIGPRPFNVHWENPLQDGPGGTGGGGPDISNTTIATPLRAIEPDGSHPESPVQQPQQPQQAPASPQPQPQSNGAPPQPYPAAPPVYPAQPTVEGTQPQPYPIQAPGVDDDEDPGPRRGRRFRLGRHRRGAAPADATQPPLQSQPSTYTVVPVVYPAQGQPQSTGSPAAQSSDGPMPPNASQSPAPSADPTAASAAPQPSDAPASASPSPSDSPAPGGSEPPASSDSPAPIDATPTDAEEADHDHPHGRHGLLGRHGGGVHRPGLPGHLGARGSNANPEAAAARERHREARRAARLQARNERIARYNRRARPYLLISADLQIIGAVANGQGIDAFMDQRQHPSGRSVSFAPRLGLEAEVIPRWVKLRIGGYLEPSRYVDVAMRPHFTGGFDLKTITTTLFGLLEPTAVQISGLIDVGSRYLNAGLSIGIWE